jgi:hypothetical protein
MSPDEVRTLLGEPEWVRMPLDELEVQIEGTQGLALYFADRLLLGFAKDELVLVQSLPGLATTDGDAR